MNFLKKSFVRENFVLNLHPRCENSSVGRARPCQGRGRGFESRFSLFFIENPIVARMAELVDARDLKSRVQ